MSIQQMSGLAILQAMAKGELPAPSITQTMPMSLVQAEEGSVPANGIIRARTINGRNASLGLAYRF